jgi:type IV pilus assembly protein PilO
MSKNFEIPAGLRDIVWGSPEVLVRAALGVLLLGNLVAAGFALHWSGDSPQALESKIESTRQQIIIARGQLSRAKGMSAKITLAKDQGGAFLTTYMTPRKTTYSTILGELNQMAQTAGVKMRDSTITPEHVEGSNSLSQLTITSGYEATYPNLVKFINLLDRSQRFLIIESLTAAPQSGTGNLLVSIKLDTFVRDDVEDQS